MNKVKFNLYNKKEGPVPSNDPLLKKRAFRFANTNKGEVTEPPLMREFDSLLLAPFFCKITIENGPPAWMVFQLRIQGVGQISAEIGRDS